MYKTNQLKQNINKREEKQVSSQLGRARCPINNQTRSYPNEFPNVPGDTLFVKIVVVYRLAFFITNPLMVVLSQQCIERQDLQQFGGLHPTLVSHLHNPLVRVGVQ